MGSFDHPCLLSGLNIGCRARAIVIPLTPTRYGAKFEGPSALSNDGAMSVYSPYCMPLVGTYADYGSFELDENDVLNRTALERSGLEVEELQMAMGCDEEKAREAGVMSRAVFLESAVDAAGMHVRKSCNEETLGVWQLEFIGYVHEGNTSDKRYKKRYVLRDGEGSAVHELHTDGQFSHDPLGKGVYHASDLLRNHKVSAAAGERIERLVYTSACEMYFDIAQRAIAQERESHARDVQFAEKYPEYKARSFEWESFSQYNGLCRLLLTDRYSDNSSRLKEWYGPLVEADDRSIIPRLHQLHVINWALYFTGRILGPPGTHPQHGEDDTVRRMLRAFSKLK